MIEECRLVVEAGEGSFPIPERPYFHCLVVTPTYSELPRPQSLRSELSKRTVHWAGLVLLEESHRTGKCATTKLIVVGVAEI